MATASQVSESIGLEQAASLLSQQIWCWGQDIMRPQGNWLLEFGFDRIEPPADRAECPSIYKLALPHGRRVLLRGFGVFYGDQKQGGVYLPRYEFQPRYIKHADLANEPWTKADLPKLRRSGKARRPACTALVQDLIDWIWRYELHTAAHLGIEYRRKTLLEWDDGTRPVVSAEDLAPAWCALSGLFSSDFDRSRRRLTSFRLSW